MMKRLRDGVKVDVLQKGGRREQKTLRYFDFDKPAENCFWVVNQLWIQGEIYKLRPDVIIYVNGIPLITIELKNSDVAVKNAYDDNLTRYRKQIPQLMYYNVVLVVSNGLKTLTGGTFAAWNFFKPWLHVDDESKRVDKKRIEEYGCSLEYFVRGLLGKAQLLDYLQNFVLIYNDNKKICAQNHQFLGVNRAIEHFKQVTSDNCPAEDKGKLGVFWHTQGSGKSFSMVFFARKLKRTFAGDYTFLVVTDREDLDEQIYKNFLHSGFMNPQYECRPKDSNELRKMLSTQNLSIVFTLIQKFRWQETSAYPLLSDRSNIIVMIDEAHRTQYRSLAENLRTGLPNAMFMAFTGTPLFGSKSLTNKWFGKTVSEYNFMQAVEDDATRPIVYKNHLPEMQQENTYFSKDFEAIIEQDNLTDEEVQKLEQQHATELEVLRRPERLKVVAQDIVSNFPCRGFLGKGMVISVDKFTCVQMYDFVQQYWNEEIAKLGRRTNTEPDAQKRQRLKTLHNWMKETEMAVIVSPEDGENEKFAKVGLDIATHRRKMEAVDENGRDIVDRFKDADDPLRIVFVCAMWLTGFDAPTVSTLYLDKPMNGHTLMQTIARANRVTEWTDLFGRTKTCGEVISYCNLYSALMKAIGTYGDSGDDNDGGTASAHGGEQEENNMMTLDHQYDLLKEAIDECSQWCKGFDVDLDAILNIDDTYQHISLFDDYANAIIGDQERKLQFRIYDNAISSLYDSCLPDIIRRKEEFRLAQVVHYLREIIDNNVDHGNLETARRHIRELLDESLLPKPIEANDSLGTYGNGGEEEPPKRPFVIRERYKDCDLSKVDLNKIRERYQEAPHKNLEFQDLAELLQAKVNQMVHQNSERRNFAERLQQILDSYNAGSQTSQQNMEDLIAFMGSLTEEQQRAQREGLTEQELEIYDILLKPKLSKADEVKVKKGARDLLRKLRENEAHLFPVHWFKDTQGKMRVLTFLNSNLDSFLPESYDTEIFNEKRQRIYTKLLMHGDSVRDLWARIGA